MDSGSDANLRIQVKKSGRIPYATGQSIRFPVPRDVYRGVYLVYVYVNVKLSRSESLYFWSGLDSSNQSEFEHKKRC